MKKTRHLRWHILILDALGTLVPRGALAVGAP